MPELDEGAGRRSRATLSCVTRADHLPSLCLSICACKVSMSLVFAVLGCEDEAIIRVNYCVSLTPPERLQTAVVSAAVGITKMTSRLLICHIQGFGKDSMVHLQQVLRNDGERIREAHAHR